MYTLGTPMVQQDWSLAPVECFLSDWCMAFHNTAKLARIRGRILRRCLLASNTGLTDGVSLAGLGSW